MIEPSPDAAIEIHSKVREIITSLCNIKPGGKALDAAAGKGYMTEWLSKQGFHVTAVDIANEEWKVKGIRCNWSDFNKRIEAESESFDLVVSIETIEHVENPFLFIREVARVLVPRGIGIISTPNVHSIRSRIKYLFTGLPRLFEYVNDDHMGQHICPVSIGQFLYAGKLSNLELIEIFSTGPKKLFLTSLLFRVLNEITLIGARIFRVTRRHYPDYYLNVLSNKHLRELTRDGFLILIFEKRER